MVNDESRRYSPREKIVRLTDEWPLPGEADRIKREEGDLLAFIHLN